MAADFPELSSFGTLLKFGLVMEETLEELSRLAAQEEACTAHHEELASCARKHGRRREHLERIRREWLNEVVLQPIYGMDRAEYIAGTDLSSGAGDRAGTLAQFIEAEQAAARFYEDAATVAAHVLSGVDRIFKKLGRESKSLAEDFRSATE
jgi:hypothetical protein